MVCLNIGSTIRNQYKVQLLQQVFPCGLEKPLPAAPHLSAQTRQLLHRQLGGMTIHALTPEEKAEAWCLALGLASSLLISLVDQS